jgi:tetratricopeptide (TPR) repeat protein
MPEALFVGRERETDVYKKFLARKTPWVLIITGLGGIGKSTLLHRLTDYTLTEPALSETGVVTLDFADEELRIDPLKLLDKLTKDTIPYCDAQQIDVELKKSLQQNFDQLAQLSAERAQTGVNEAEDPALREMRHQMRELATEAFYTQIKAFKLDRLVIMLDTCEWLNEPEGMEVGQWILNELIPGIHTRIRQKGCQCSIVMASRLQPRLDVINGQDQRRLTLPMLGKVEVDQYLEHMGMQDPDLRQRVYEVTHGHALCISIIGDFWQKREEQKQPFTIADLPELQLQEFSEIAVMQFTNERVLKQLKSPFKELTRYGVLLRSFDLPLLKSVFPELLPEQEALERFNQLIRYPYIESRGNYRYAFHELVHEALAEETQREEPEEWKSYHKRALDYFTTVSPRSPDWYYHLLAYDEKQGLVEWQKAIQEARESGKREFIGALLQAALDKALKLSPAAHAEIAYEQGRFNYYGVQWEEALKSYKEALTAFQEMGVYSEQAKVLHCIGDVQRVLARQDDALESYTQALAFFRQAGDQLGEAKCSQAIGDVQRLRNEPRAALLSYKQALDLFRRVGDRSEEAKVLEAMGDVQRLLNDYDAALQSYEEALALYQEEKDRYKRAKVLKAIGDVHRLQQDQDAALESYAQALALFGELKEPAEEANVRRAMEEVQQPQSELEALLKSNGRASLSGLSLSEVGLPNSPSSPPLPDSQSAVSPPVPVREHFEQRRGSFRGVVLLPITLALLLIGGSGFLYYATAFHPVQLHAEATAAVQNLLTAQAQATGQAAVATAIALQNIYNQATSGPLALNDPLSDNSQNNQWAEGTACQFRGGAYHVSETQKTYVYPCTAGNVAPPSNFAYQVQMTIVSGDEGCTIFRYTSANNGQYYAFCINQDGHYKFMTVNNIYTVQQSGFSSAITPGLKKINSVVVIAQGAKLDLYVNRQFVVTVTDTTFSYGVIGVGVLDDSHSTEVAFRNVQVWTLPQATGQAAVATALYNQTINGPLAYNDPLTDNSQNNQWAEGTACQFRGGAYHASVAQKTYLQPCTAANVAPPSNFAYQVQMTIVSGDEGCSIFRYTSADNGSFYAFCLSQDGHYKFIVTTPKSYDVLQSGFSSAITPGLKKINSVMVIAQGAKSDLYVNRQFVVTVTDTTFSYGVIGVGVLDDSHSTEVAFRNVQVWKL